MRHYKQIPCMRKNTNILGNKALSDSDSDSFINTGSYYQCLKQFTEHLPWGWASDTSVSVLVCHHLDRHPVLSTSLSVGH